MSALNRWLLAGVGCLLWLNSVNDASAAPRIPLIWTGSSSVQRSLQISSDVAENLAGLSSQWIGVGLLGMPATRFPATCLIETSSTAVLQDDSSSVQESTAGGRGERTEADANDTAPAASSNADGLKEAAGTGSEDTEGGQATTDRLRQADVSTSAPNLYQSQLRAARAIEFSLVVLGMLLSMASAVFLFQVNRWSHGKYAGRILWFAVILVPGWFVGGVMLAWNHAFWLRWVITTG